MEVNPVQVVGSSVSVGRGRGRGGGVPVLPSGMRDAWSGDVTIKSGTFVGQFEDSAEIDTNNARDCQEIDEYSTSSVPEEHARNFSSSDALDAILPSSSKHVYHSSSLVEGPPLRQRKDFNQEFPFDNQKSSHPHQHKDDKGKNWVCPCGNTNWPWRTHCNLCHNAKPVTLSGNEMRDGAGSGFYERQDRASLTAGNEVAADGFDDFGRRVKSASQYAVSANNTHSESAPTIATSVKETKEQAALRRLQEKYFLLNPDLAGDAPSNSTSHTSGIAAASSKGHFGHTSSTTAHRDHLQTRQEQLRRVGNRSRSRSRSRNRLNTSSSSSSSGGHHFAYNNNNGGGKNSSAMRPGDRQQHSRDRHSRERDRIRDRPSSSHSNQHRREHSRDRRSDYR